MAGGKRDGRGGRGVGRCVWPRVSSRGSALSNKQGGRIAVRGVRRGAGGGVGGDEETGDLVDRGGAVAW